MENLVVGLIVAIALAWGVRGIVRSVRSVKKIGERQPADACTTDSGRATSVASRCGCADAGSCQIATRCGAANLRDRSAATETDKNSQPHPVPATRRSS